MNPTRFIRKAYRNSWPSVLFGFIKSVPQSVAEFDSFAGPVYALLNLGFALSRRSNFPRRRLELDPIRDSLLSLAGEPERQIGGEVVLEKDSRYKDSGLEKKVFNAPRRTICLSVN